MLREFQEFY